ncbi:tRNA methyltransferase 10 homolog A-like [Acanthaster planci]|uniref:tRNA (guanine(9)-N(1))-methyltransferase n=1 Tax=Acanthaster planci TaxID=133434 RepID=A0A8B7XM73_ACAPL|nr:tRNA methyltransferase 10 homolog A-like [Acanthaster planci]
MDDTKGIKSDVADAAMSANQDERDGTQEEVSTTSGTVPVSKNQMKKMMKNAEWRERRTAKRLKEREKRKLKKIQEREGMPEALDDGQVRIKRRRMNDPEASEIRVAIDCTYDHLMNDLEIKKLCKQVQRCYAENRSLTNKPLQLYICGLVGRFQQISDQVITGYKSWDVHWKTDGPEAAFGRDNIVYLTSESPNLLTELQTDKVYVIGGLVDHNHYKGHCFALAQENGWSHAQLPISDYIMLRDRKVLAINHVYEILLAFIKTKDWKEAFLKVLPQRKVAAVKESAEVKGGSSHGAKNPDKVDLAADEATDKDSVS